MVKLRGAGLVLRALTRRDRHEWDSLRRRNQAWLAPWESQDPTGEDHAVTFGHYVRTQAQAARDQVGFGWVITEGGPMLGHITLSHIAWGAMRSATIGYWVTHERAGEGIAPRAVALVTDYAFFDLGLHRVEVNIRPDNHASLRVVEKLGFREEGLRERYIFIDGQWRDHRSFALVAEETGSLVQKFWPDSD